ncbi:MAG: hypothetical protein J4G05_04705 [Chlorobi bacterium]|nr:hypothetical protein [Chlorobiota bacterium]
MDQELSQLLTAIASCVIALTAIVGVGIARGQLLKMGDAANVQTVQMLMNMNAAMNSALDEIAVASKDMVELTLEGNAQGGVTHEQKKFTAKQLAAKKSRYLNALDQLAGCLLRNKRIEKQYKQDYEHVITTAVKKYLMDTGSEARYRNLMKLYQKWNED